MLSVVELALLRRLLKMFYHNLAFRVSKWTSNKLQPLQRCAKSFSCRSTVKDWFREWSIAHPLKVNLKCKVTLFTLLLNIFDLIMYYVLFISSCYSKKKNICQLNPNQNINLASPLKTSCRLKIKAI